MSRLAVHYLREEKRGIARPDVRQGADEELLEIEMDYTQTSIQGSGFEHPRYGAGPIEGQIREHLSAIPALR